MQKKRIRIADLKKGQRGFSLIELMIVIVILGLLASMLVPKIMDRPNEARVTKAKMDMKALDSALKLYKLDTGRYPTTEQGLQALITKPDTRPVPRNYRKGGYLDSATAPVDPWGYDYIYRSPGEEGRPYELISLGADGMEGGEDYDADIKSWE
ncbi:type II secretion system major pseudopilin GspG [Maridesulfovibrio salexigens]|uniref:Type II secretion system core protein G n=1 Tax=Maridesulfovibrio salexigens (strain ATCC 14822 / DSM 2638 / NCIMB 8403 / VKM B-1763) TaxID=526222 RepID=C6BTG1_MARSD|nr:type II secretion system major pseudopilin GspG [Maridesulfovibrio salexigens]ACS81642.1 general secretion pathway protein G [Maridesulfovibrio salexigens DSM 2638]